MKRIAYSFLLVILLSCDRSHPLNYVVARLGTAVDRTYSVVSVTDSSMVVIPQASRSDARDTVLFRNIDRISIQRNTTGYGWIGGLAACSAVAATAVVIEQSSGTSGGNGMIGVLGYPFFPLGAYIGCKASDGMQEIDINTKEGVQTLKDHLPLQKIK